MHSSCRVCRVARWFSSGKFFFFPWGVATIFIFSNCLKANQVLNSAREAFARAQLERLTLCPKHAGKPIAENRIASFVEEIVSNTNVQSCSLLCSFLFFQQKKSSFKSFNCSSDNFFGTPTDPLSTVEVVGGTYMSRIEREKRRSVHSPFDDPFNDRAAKKVQIARHHYLLYGSRSQVPVGGAPEKGSFSPRLCTAAS